MNLLTKLGDLEHKVATWVRAEVIKVNAFINNIKTIEQSPTVQTLEQILLPLLDGVFPAARIPAIGLVVVKWFKTLNSIGNTTAAELAKSDADIAKDGIAELLKLNLIDATAYAVLMSAMNSYVTVNTSVLNGNPIPVQDALKAVPLVYDSEKILVDLPVAPALTVPTVKVIVTDTVDRKATDAEAATLKPSGDIPGHPGFPAGKDPQGEDINSFTPPPIVAGQ